MSQCDRAWEVEALRDGLVAESMRASVERHIEHCAACQQTRASLAELGALLREAPVLGADEVSVRRRRQRILSLAHSERVPPPRGRRIGFAALAAVAIAIAILTVWSSSLEPRTVIPAAKPSVVATRAVKRELVRVDAAQGAELVRRAIENAEVIELEGGRVSLHVTRGPHDPRVIVRTPDAEIEDIGTVFSVTVENRTTTLVEVREGEVIVRQRGRAPHHVTAGERYAPQAAAQNLASVEPQAEAKPRPTAHRPARAHDATVPPAVHAEREATAHDDEQGEAADRKFARAVQELEQGDPSAAAVLLERFSAQHKSDVRAEDAAFLRVIALERAHRDEDAKAAARAYLARFPGGFRAPEAKRLLGI